MLDGKRSSVQASQGSMTVISISHTLLHNNWGADSARLSDKARSLASSSPSPIPPLLSSPLGPWSCLTSDSVKTPVELAFLVSRPGSRNKGPQPSAQGSLSASPSQQALDLCQELEARWRPFVLLDRPTPRRINPIPTSVVFEPGAPLGLPADSVICRFRILPPALYRCRGPSDTHLCYVLYTGIETIPAAAVKSQPGRASSTAVETAQSSSSAVQGQAAAPLPSGSLSTLVNVPCVPRAVRNEVLSRPAAANISQDLAVLVACVGLAEQSLQSLGRNRNTPFAEVEAEAEEEAEAGGGTGGSGSIGGSALGSSEGAAESPPSETPRGPGARHGAEAPGSPPMPGSPALSPSLGSNRFVGIGITPPAAEPGTGAAKRPGLGGSRLAAPAGSGSAESALEKESQRQEAVHVHHALETVRDLASRLLAYSDANDLSEMSSLIRALGRRGRELSRALSEVTAGAAAARERERCLAHRMVPARTKGFGGFGGIGSGPSEAAAPPRQAMSSSALSSVSCSSRSSGQSTPSAAGSAASGSSGGAGSPVAAVRFGQLGQSGFVGTGSKSKAAQPGAQAKAQEFQDASEVFGGSSRAGSLSGSRMSLMTAGTTSHATASEAPAGPASSDSPAAAPGFHSVEEFAEIQPAPAQKKPAPAGAGTAVGPRAAASSGVTRVGPIATGPRVMPVLAGAGAETFFEASADTGASSSSDSAHGVAIESERGKRRSSEPGYGHAFHCSLERQKTFPDGSKSQAPAAPSKAGPHPRPDAPQGSSSGSLFKGSGSFLKKLLGFRRGTSSVLL